MLWKFDYFLDNDSYPFSNKQVYFFFSMYCYLKQNKIELFTHLNTKNSFIKKNGYGILQITLF